jgi:hypothetical protein
MVIAENERYYYPCSRRYPFILVQIDSLRRVTLPPPLGIKPGAALDLEVLEDGRIILVSPYP